ncbi:MAG: hypothetical protein ACI4K7_10550 [Oscillospiraceae bacterium]
MGQSAERRRKTSLSERIEALEKLLKKLKTEKKELKVLEQFYNEHQWKEPDEYSIRLYQTRRMLSDSSAEITRLEKTLASLKKKFDMIDLENERKNCNGNKK